MMVLTFRDKYPHEKEAIRSRQMAAGNQTRKWGF
jgi:hypothetical protein